MRAVDVNPGDGDHALEEMRDAGAEIVETQKQTAGAVGRSTTQ
jgi:hypothetical protein